MTDIPNPPWPAAGGVLIPVHESVFQDRDPVVMQELDSEIKRRIVGHFGSVDDVTIHALEGVSFGGVEYPGWVFIRCHRPEVTA